MMEETVNDFTVKTNLIQAASMFLLEPLTRHDKQVVQYRPYSRLHNGLAKRIAQLEQRQVLLEADLSLLKGQLEWEGAKI